MIFDAFFGCILALVLMRLCVHTWIQFQAWRFREKLDDEQPGLIARKGPLYSSEAIRVIQDQLNPRYDWLRAPEMVQVTLDEYKERFEDEPIEASFTMKFEAK